VPSSLVRYLVVRFNWTPNSVNATYTGAEFRSPASVCAILSSTPAATRTSLLGDLSGGLKDGTYYSDTLQLLMQLFVSGRMSSATCSLVQNTFTKTPVSDLTTGPALYKSPPVATCYRNVSNLDYISFVGVAIEFANPVIFHSVSIDCNGVERPATRPLPDPFNTFYIKGTVCSGPVIVKYYLKPG